jgi:hypothetical protein
MHRQFAMDGLGRLPSMHLRVATYHFPQTLSEIETWARRNLITNKSFALHCMQQMCLPSGRNLPKIPGE